MVEADPRQPITTDPAAALRTARGSAHPDERAEHGPIVGCITGALSLTDYDDGLRAAGLGNVTITFTHPVGDGVYSAIVTATKPARR